MKYLRWYRSPHVAGSTWQPTSATSTGEGEVWWAPFCSCSQHLGRYQPWQQAGSKTMLKTSLPHSSDAASAGAWMPNGGWLLAAPLFCQQHSVLMLTWNKQHLHTCTSWCTTEGYSMLPICWMTAFWPSNPLNYLGWYKHLKKMCCFTQQIPKTHPVYWPPGVKFSFLILGKTFIFKRMIYFVLNKPLSLPCLVM